MDLTQQVCVACEGGMPPLTRHEAEVLLAQIPGWMLSDDSKTISRDFVLADFKECLKLIQTVGEIAESEGHHPDIHLTDYKKLRIDLSTHAISGLSNNDFIVAAKINKSRGEGLA